MKRANLSVALLAIILMLGGTHLGTVQAQQTDEAISQPQAEQESTTEQLAEPEPTPEPAPEQPAEPEPEPAPEQLAEPEPEPAPTTPEPAPELAADEPGTDYSGLWRTLRGLRQGLVGGVTGAVLVATPRFLPTLPPPMAEFDEEVSPPEPAPPQDTVPSEPGIVTLMGRGTTVTVIDEYGAAHVLKTADVVLRNQPGFKLSHLPRAGRAMSFADDAMLGFDEEAGPAAEVPPDEKEATAEAAEGQPEPGEEASAQDAEAETAPPAETPEPTAREEVEVSDVRERILEEKNTDIARLKELRGEGNRFYTSDGKPMTNEELDTRLATGHIEDVRAVDAKLNAWSTKSSYAAPE